MPHSAYVLTNQDVALLREVIGRVRSGVFGLSVSQSPESQGAQNYLMGIGQNGGSSIAVAAEGTITIYYLDSSGAWATDGFTETMRNAHPTLAIGANKKVSWMFHPRSQQYLALPIEC